MPSIRHHHIGPCQKGLAILPIILAAMALSTGQAAAESEIQMSVIRDPVPAVVMFSDPHGLIAFCRPTTRPCVCSVETVEETLTPGELLLLLRERRRAGAMSTAELVMASTQMRQACGGGLVAESSEVSGTPRMVSARVP